MAMDGMRRAALTLHGLQPADREWVLSQLDVSERDAMTRLLAELGELGIPSDQGLVQEALVGREGLSVVAPLSSTAKVRSASPEQMHAVVSQEPDHFIACLLKVEEWPWKHALLTALGEARQRAIVLSMQTVETMPMLAATIVEHIGRSLAASPLGIVAKDRSAQADGKIFSSWLSRFRLWHR